jgi:ABC-type glycerol-3-phosphate transport system substrate-binding protein
MLRRWPFALFIALILSLGLPISAQSTETVLQIAIPQFYRDLFAESILPAFEADNPDIRVEIVIADGFGSLPASNDVEADLDSAAATFSKADLVLADRTLNPTYTRAGYVLDLQPLVSTDPTFNAGEFYTGVLDSFRWDNGLWALPVATDIIMMFYQPAAFDAAGLAYPSASWTVHDWANAIRALSEFDAAGQLSKRAFDAFEGFGPVFLAFNGQDLRDDSVLPATPDLTSASAAEVVNALAELYSGGYFDSVAQEGGATVRFGGPNSEGTPLVIGRSAFAGFMAGGGAMAAPLPGGGIINAQGFAISAGTRHPEAAYRLLKYLTNSPEAVSVFTGMQPARSTVNVIDSAAGGGRRGMVLGGPNNQLAPAAQTVIDSAYPSARPMRDLHFTDSLTSLANSVVSGAVTENLLQEQELAELQRLQAADARRSTPIVVNTPRSQVQLAAGEIALRVGIGSVISPLPNQSDWDAIADAFADADPQVGAVYIEGTIPTNLSEMNEQYDCFITTDGLSNNPDLSQIRALDPLLQSDASFNPNDVLGGILAGQQRDGQTWAYPLTISPEALRYNPEVFARAGVPEPQNGWTVSQFEDALRQITASTGESAFVPGGMNTTYLMLLAAAYGGNPLDTRTTPTTINYADPATINALQQLLDLAVGGQISYQALAGMGRGIGFGQSGAAISPTTVSAFGGLGFGGGGAFIIQLGGPSGQNQQDTTRIVAYPRGITLNGVSYATIAGYIGSRTAHVDACYRFLSAVAKRLDVVGGMPAYRSQLNNPAVIAQNGESTAQFFTEFAALLDSPNTITVGQLQFGFGESYWLLRAMDEYVASGGQTDLAAALTDAQTYTNEYRACTAALPPFNPETTDFQAYAASMRSCASAVDPTADFGF